MKWFCSRMLALHRFLARRAFYPVLLSSVFACVFVVGRVAMTESFAYVFLIWNLFLAWIPYGFSLIAARLHRSVPQHWVLQIVPGALWLLFFPNAPYMLTDLVHLWRIPPAVWWYDLGMIASFAWTGCFLAVASLHVMQSIVRAYAGRVWGWLFVLAALGLSGLGVYLGRFARLNSWDLLIAPRMVLGEIATSLLHPVSQPRAVGVSGMFAALLLVCYLTFVAYRPLNKE